MYTNYDQFIIGAFREVESEIGVLTENEIENIIQEKSVPQLENWLRRMGHKPKDQWASFNKDLEK